MTTLREAAQQALEALCLDAGGDAQVQKEAEAIGALRAALEQQEQEQAEPVATVAMDVSRAHISWDGKYFGQRPDMKIAMLLKDLPVGTLLYTHPPRRETEPAAFDALVAISLLTHLGGEVADYEDVVEAVRRLHAVNQELLEALKRIELACTGTWVNKDWVVKECSAAIAKAEGQA